MQISSIILSWRNFAKQQKKRLKSVNDLNTSTIQQLMEDSASPGNNASEIFKRSAFKTQKNTINKNASPSRSLTVLQLGIFAHTTRLLYEQDMQIRVNTAA